MRARLGIAPIAWTNDDLPELGGNTPLEACLSEARAAGFSGIETGGKFPDNAEELGPILAEHELSICGGWYSGTVLGNDLEAEKDRVWAQLAMFRELNAPCLVYGETTETIQDKRKTPLHERPRLDDDQMRIYGRHLTSFAEWSAESGMPIALHHHMGTVIESEGDIDCIMNWTGEAVDLLFDVGHLAFAGGRILPTLERHVGRIAHFHAKDVRRTVTDQLDRNHESFLDAVLKGAFTVPGDGDLDFLPCVKCLADHGYEGWFVVEAEQDPVQAPPLEYARIGFQTMQNHLLEAGYEILDIHKIDSN